MKRNKMSEDNVSEETDRCSAQLIVTMLEELSDDGLETVTNRLKQELYKRGMYEHLAEG